MMFKAKLGSSRVWWQPWLASSSWDCILLFLFLDHSFCTLQRELLHQICQSSSPTLFQLSMLCSKCLLCQCFLWTLPLQARSVCYLLFQSPHQCPYHQTLNLISAWTKTESIMILIANRNHCSYLNFNMDCTGPKISSFAISISSWLF